MKKIVIALVLSLSVFTLYAANSVKLVKGDKSVFQQECFVNVIIDDHDTMIDGKGQTAEVYYGNQSRAEYEKFVADLDRGHESFITYFNEKRKLKTKLTMTSANDNASYTLKIKVSSMNVGNAGSVVWGMSPKAGGALINGTMLLINNQNGETVCDFEFSGVKGLMAPVFRARAISVYRYLADGLLKTIE